MTDITDESVWHWTAYKIKRAHTERYEYTRMHVYTNRVHARQAMTVADFYENNGQKKVFKKMQRKKFISPNWLKKGNFFSWIVNDMCTLTYSSSRTTTTGRENKKKKKNARRANVYRIIFIYLISLSILINFPPYVCT